jgi:hypothetical protein
LKTHFYLNQKLVIFGIVSYLRRLMQAQLGERLQTVHNIDREAHSFRRGSFRLKIIPSQLVSQNSDGLISNFPILKMESIVSNNSAMRIEVALGK